MTWNHAKSLEVFGLGCSGLGNFRFTSVVPGDFAIQITFKVLCSLIILLWHTYGFESYLYGIASGQFICEPKTLKFLVWHAADLEVFGSAVQRTWKGLYLAVFFTYK